jgi:hypothetical protein
MSNSKFGWTGVVLVIPMPREKVLERLSNLRPPDK